MAIPPAVVIKNGELPPKPGVYFMKDAVGKLLYIGKATSLRTRVSSYFVRPADARIAKMVEKIATIDYEETPSAIEALLLEAKLIKKHQPPYNVTEKDDKSFVHLAFTDEDFPQPVLIREHEFARMSKRQFLATFGPFRSAASIQAALDALRKTFPWTTCGARRAAGRTRACFYRHLGLCPGVCTGEISSADYKKIIRGLIAFFDGKRSQVVRDLRRQMVAAAKAQRFEDATVARNRLQNLEHLRDVGVIKKEHATVGGYINIFGRLEAYDISNILGESAVGSMVVFEDGVPKKRAYRKFLIKTVQGANDTAMMEEVLFRRFGRGSIQGKQGGDAQSPRVLSDEQPQHVLGPRDAEPVREPGHPAHRHPRAAGFATPSSLAFDDAGSWPDPDLILIDGGVGQINAAKRALERRGKKIPLVGLAKGFDRKQDELVYDRSDYELARLVRAFKPMLQHIRDEAHRFAIGYHRKVRARKFLGKQDVPRT